jgi:hypothetical protein
MERVHPDVAVLGIMVPNDLSDWDVQDERRAWSGIGFGSLMRFVFGPRAAIMLLNENHLAQAITPERLEYLDTQIARLRRIREGTGSAPIPLFVFLFKKGEGVGERFATLPGAVVLESDCSDVNRCFLPNDGHPTAWGNAQSARMLADALDRIHVR